MDIAVREIAEPGVVYQGANIIVWLGLCWGQARGDEILKRHDEYTLSAIAEGFQSKASLFWGLPLGLLLD